MKFKKFVIRNYRAISDPITVDVEKHSLIPIIGVNECGKTTILQAIFAFDAYNDDLNSGRHLEDTHNLYSTENQPARISAIVAMTPADFRAALKTVERESSETGASEAAKKSGAPNDTKTALDAAFRRYKRLATKIAGHLTITRNLQSKEYELDQSIFDNAKLNNLLCNELIRFVPHILYFDDFRDSIDSLIKIPTKDPGSGSGWLSMIEQLFKKTDPNYSVYGLNKLEERQRKSTLAKINSRLNETLTEEWQKFKLENSDSLRIHLDYIPPKSAATDGGELRFDVVETNKDKSEHFFYLRDRSKGFYWFFNFVMKLEFNPKLIGEDGQSAIFLLDEPGSYLHASAQSKLCKKLTDLSKENSVIYCTHSHYLLDPELIPTNQVRIAEKNVGGSIRLTPVHSYEGDFSKRSAFQPVWDALQIKPFILDLTSNSVIIAEGIYDYYCLEMFKPLTAISILPSVGAPSVKFFISLMLAWNTDYRALWDNDKDGRDAHKDAVKFFGQHEADEHFHLLPLPSENSKQRILQDLFNGDDLRMYKKELDLESNTRFEGIILELFFSKKRTELLDKTSQETKRAFIELFDSLKLKQGSATSRIK